MRPLIISGNTHNLYPVDIVFGIITTEERDEFGDSYTFSIPKSSPYGGDWGSVLSYSMPLDEFEYTPRDLDLLFLSITEQCLYYYEGEITNEIASKYHFQEEANRGIYSYFLVGVAPYGGIAVWMGGEVKSILLNWLHADKINVDASEFASFYSSRTINQVCDFYINNDETVKNNLEQNGLPLRDLFDNYMKQFTYRYQVIFEHWDEDEEKWNKYDKEKDNVISEFEYIEESLFDGTHDKLHDGGLMKYHEAGKPKKLALKWHIKKSDYSAYFWFEEEEICAIFNKFYGQHPDTKSDFIIHIDPINKKYELSLYRYGLKEPLVIPEKAYQLIVFKSGFENYRSENYNQPTGAWIW